MDLIETPLFAYILAWFGFMGGIWALFDCAEKIITEETKLSIKEWIESPGTVRRSSLSLFAELSDKVFGRRPPEWPEPQQPSISHSIAVSRESSATNRCFECPILVG